MGERGPLKVPKHLRPVADGTEAGTEAERVTPSSPDTPFGWSGGDAELAGLWDETVQNLDRAGLLAGCDGPSVELMLRHFLAARRASDVLMAGELIEADYNHGGRKRNPAGAEFRQQSTTYLEYAKQLGMTFASRARIPRRQDDGGEETPFAATG
jgi:phage terminase small subunit